MKESTVPEFQYLESCIEGLDRALGLPVMPPQFVTVNEHYQLQALNDRCIYLGVPHTNLTARYMLPFLQCNPKRSRWARLEVEAEMVISWRRLSQSQRGSHLLMVLLKLKLVRPHGQWIQGFYNHMQATITIMIVTIITMIPYYPCKKARHAVGSSSQ